MIGSIAALLLLIPLASPFGDATATATSADDGLRLEVSVEVDGVPVAVLVRGLAAGDVELPSVALANRGNGKWEGIVEVPIVENIRLGFEAIPERGPAAVSELHTLIELGVDSAIFSMNRPEVVLEQDDDPLGSPQGQRWGWLGLAAGAAALTLVAVWTLDSYRSRGDDEADDRGLEAPSSLDESTDPIVD